jgi:hypothetical protein
MICSSVKRDPFISASYSGGLYSNSEEFQGLRSRGLERSRGDIVSTGMELQRTPLKRPRGILDPQNKKIFRTRVFWYILLCLIM